MISGAVRGSLAGPRTERIFRKFDEVFIHMHALSEHASPVIVAEYPG